MIRDSLSYFLGLFEVLDESEEEDDDYEDEADEEEDAAKKGKKKWYVNLSTYRIY